MGIKHLRMLLLETCMDSGMYRYNSVHDFLKSERKRLLKESKQKETCENSYITMQHKTHKPYFVGIDAYLYAIRYKRVFKKIEYGFLRQIMLSLSSGIVPIYVFDGRAPEQKKKTIEKRRFKKQALRNKLNDLSNIDKHIQQDQYNLSNEEQINEEQIKNINDLSLEELVNYMNAFQNGILDKENSYYNILKKIMDSDILQDDEMILNDNNESDNQESDDSESNNQKADNHDQKNNPNNKPVLNKMSNYLLHNAGDSSNEKIRLTKRSINIEYEDIINLKKFLDLLKIPYLTAVQEADDLMALLYKKCIIQACQSDDMDMLPKGCGNVIQITKNGTYQFLLPEILNTLNLTYEQFVDLCILLGCDYYTSYLPRIYYSTLYDVFKKCETPSLENFVLEYSKNDPDIRKHLESYKKTRGFFLTCSERSDKYSLNYNISLFNLNIIITYFKSIGINLNDTDHRKFELMVKNVNKFISTLSQNIPT